jgi:hypothetical protein
MTRPTEDRIRAALDARATLVTERELSPSRPPDPRGYRGWLLPVGLAAAVTTVLAVTSSVPVQRLAGPDPADPPVTATVTGPTERTEATNDGVRTAVPTTTSVPTTGTPAPPPASTTKPVSYQGLTIDIPVNWTLTAVEADPGFACVSSSPESCEFTITRADGGGYHVLHADDPFQTASGHPCAELAGGPVTQVAADTLRAGDRTAQYRRYATSCDGGPQFEFEQWTFATVPAAKFHRTTINAVTEPAVVAAVAGARFDRPATTHPVNDFGLITGYQRDAGGVVLEFDRATPVLLNSLPPEWDHVNANARTYRYRLATDLNWIDEPRLCFNPVDPGIQPCDLETLLRRIDEGDRRSDGGPPVGTIPVWVSLSELGVVTSIS